MIDLRLGDCLELMRGIPDASIDAVVTDPPYNVGFNYGENHNDHKVDYADWCAAWLTELERVCSGAIAISCGIVNLSMWTKIREPNWVMCWWKPAAMGRSPVGFCNWEPMLLYGKSKGKGGVDVVRAPIKILDDTGDHPCPKPIDWARGFIELLSKEGMTILDPFAGSGTTGVACVKLNRNFIGMEINPDYFKIAEKRIADAQKQLVMPIGEENAKQVALS